MRLRSGWTAAHHDPGRRVAIHQALTRPVDKAKYPKIKNWRDPCSNLVLTIHPRRTANSLVQRAGLYIDIFPFLYLDLLTSAVLPSSFCASISIPGALTSHSTTFTAAPINPVMLPLPAHLRLRSPPRAPWAFTFSIFPSWHAHQSSSAVRGLDSAMVLSTDGGECSHDPPSQGGTSVAAGSSRLGNSYKTRINV